MARDDSFDKQREPRGATAGQTVVRDDKQTKVRDNKWTMASRPQGAKAVDCGVQRQLDYSD